MKTLFKMVIGLGLLSLLLAACAPQSTFPTGKFTLPGKQYEGVYFDENGTWYAFFYGETVAEGTYSTKGDLYIEESNDSNCGETPMSFKYSFDGANLKFELTEQSKNDTCENRRLSFDDITYVLVE